MTIARTIDGSRGIAPSEDEEPLATAIQIAT